MSVKVSCKMSTSSSRKSTRCGGLMSVIDESGVISLNCVPKKKEILKSYEIHHSSAKQTLTKWSYQRNNLSLNQTNLGKTLSGERDYTLKSVLAIFPEVQF